MNVFLLPFSLFNELVATTPNLPNHFIRDDASCHSHHLFYKHATQCIDSTFIHPTVLSKQLELFKSTVLVGLTIEDTKMTMSYFIPTKKFLNFLCPQHKLVPAIHDDNTITQTQ